VSAEFAVREFLVKDLVDASLAGYLVSTLMFSALLLGTAAMALEFMDCPCPIFRNHPHFGHSLAP